MQIPAKVHYATIAMLELARWHHSGHPVAVRAISDQHAIPLPFLVQILQQLKGAGLVTSTRGSSGGYRLERAPELVNVGEIVDAIVPVNASAAAAGSGGAEPTRSNQVVQQVWDEIEEVQRQALAAITLDDLLQRVGERTSAMFYI